MNNPDKLLVKCEEDPDTHPHCPHGPMLLFYKLACPADGYFACSAFREKKACGYHTNLKELTETCRKRRYPVETCDYKKLRRKIQSVSGKYRNFCYNCNQPYVQLEGDQHYNHITLQGITDEMFANPTSFLKPVDNDKVEAQYFFDKKSLDFFVSCLKSVKIKKVVCIGAPRLHAHLKETNCAKSYLLDFDHRYFFFYDDDQFGWYNMCNNHFFEEKQRIAFGEFLKGHEEEDIAIVTDPPFGCRTEVIANSIKQLTSLYRSVNMYYKTPAVFWVYPYFSEQYIHEAMPEMEMCDYKINYTNHISYSNGPKGRKLGSPVRVFTNVSLSAIILPSNEGYKYCDACNRWTASENIHCRLCKVCPSKNGDTYRHCMQCKTCVKPKYIHCKLCRRCTQQEDHKCAEYQLKTRCWICRQVGHNEFNCRAINRPTKMSKKSSLLCLICKQSTNHNEKTCPKRRLYIREHVFMGQYTISFKKRNIK